MSRISHNTQRFVRTLAGMSLSALLAVATVEPAYAGGGKGHSSGENESESHGHGNSGESQPSSSPRAYPSRLEAKLIGPYPGRHSSHGWFRLENKVKRGILVDQRLDARAEIVPATIADTTSELKVTIARAGLDFALCTMVFDEVDDDDDDDDSPAAEYKLALRSKKQAPVSAKFGFCDLDLTTIAVENGIPDLAVGDTLSVVDPTTNTVLLTGTMRRKK